MQIDPGPPKLSWSSHVTGFPRKRGTLWFRFRCCLELNNCYGEGSVHELKKVRSFRLVYQNRYLLDFGNRASLELFRLHSCRSNLELFELKHLNSLGYEICTFVFVCANSASGFMISSRTQSPFPEQDN